MRRYAILLALTSALFIGCNDDSSSKQGDTSSCKADICKDASTLYKCTDGKPVEQPCGSDKICSVDQCIASKTDESCTKDACLNASTLKKCTDKKYTNVPCNANEVCSNDACVPKSDSPDGCKKDKCTDNKTMAACENGEYKNYSCGNGRSCIDGICVPDVAEAPSCVNECRVSADDKVIDPANDEDNSIEEWGQYHACINDALATQWNKCDAGKICLYGGCVDTFSENDACDEPTGKGFCLADGMHAVVCNNKKKTIWNCVAPCSVDAEGIVDCPKKEVKYDKQCENSYKANCYNDGNNIHVCDNHQIVSWDCYGGKCEVDDNNVIKCPRNAGIAGLGGLESGGSYGDMCNVEKYQEECIDNYFARICDLDGVIRIKPAGDCKKSSENTLKVTYSTAAACDPDTQAAPFCINNGTAIGFCAYDSDDLTTGIFKAAHCPSCESDSDAINCMYL